MHFAWTRFSQPQSIVEATMKLDRTTLLRGVVDVVFPPACVHCRSLVEPDHAIGGAEISGGFRHLCHQCVSQLEFVRAPHCTTCGHPFYGLVEGERMCVKCEGLDPAFRHGRTAVLFKGPARSLVIELKYHRGLHVLADMTEIFRRSTRLMADVRGATLVPCHCMRASLANAVITRLCSSQKRSRKRRALERRSSLCSSVWSIRRLKRRSIVAREWRI
jgi:predicted amidophosphoribosyltransferase